MSINKKLRLRGIVSGFVIWSGLIVIGVIAVPTAILLSLILLIWEALAFMVRKIDDY